MFDRANGDEQESLGWPLCADTESEKTLGPMAIRLHIYSHARPRPTSATESAQNGHFTPTQHLHSHKKYLSTFYCTYIQSIPSCIEF